MNLASRIAGLDSIMRMFGVLAVATLLLLFGGQSQSLILISFGSAVLFGCFAWLRLGTQSSVFRRMLPVIVGIYLIVGGVYFRSSLLRGGGVLLAWAWLIWLNRSEIRWLIGRLQDNEGGRGR